MNLGILSAGIENRSEFFVFLSCKVLEIKHFIWFHTDLGRPRGTTHSSVLLFNLALHGIEA